MRVHNTIGGVLVAANVVCMGLKFYEAASKQLEMATCVNTFLDGGVYHPLHQQGTGLLTKLSHYFDYALTRHEFEATNPYTALEVSFVGYGCTQLLSAKYPLFPHL